MRFFIMFVVCCWAFAVRGDTVSVPIKGLTYSITATLYSREGTERIEACSDGKLRIFDLAGTAAPREIAVGAGIFSSAQFTRDFTAVMLQQSDTVVYRVTYPLGEVSKCKTQRNNSHVFAFSDDGTRCIVYALRDSLKTVLDVATGAAHPCLGGRKDHYDKIGVAFTPDNREVLFVLPADSTAQLRMTENDSLLHAYRLPGRASTHAAISPDGKKFAVPLHASQEYTAESTIVMFDIQTGKADSADIPVKSIDSAVRLSWIGTLVYSPDGSKLYAGSYGYFFAVFDVAMKRPLFTLIGGNDGPTTMRFSADGRSVVAEKQSRGTGIDSIIRYGIADHEKTAVHVRRFRPPAVVSGFSESGDDLYGAAYYFYGPNSAEYDSLVFWNGVTNGDFLKVKYWTSGSSYSSLCFFSPEGDRLIEQTFQHQFRGPYTTTLLTVYPVAAAPSPLFSRTLSGQAIVSQDRRSIFILSEGSSTILDVASGDSVVRPFTLPSGWTIKAVQTETGTLCAMSSKQVNPQDTVFDWAGIWDLESGQCINQFVVSTHRWIDRETYIMKALFLPSGDRIVVCAGGCYGSWNDGVFLFDVRSGAKVLTYHIPSGIFGISLTPDGRQLLVGNSDRGISCLDAANGRFQRYYSTIYHRGEQGESMFAFNPKNPRQFISGNNIWELPDLLPVAHDQAAGPPAPFRTVRAFKNRITIDLPATAAAATFEINLTNGRSVVKAMVRPGLPSHRSIPVPDLARGVYMYRISAKGGGLDLRGMLLIP